MPPDTSNEFNQSGNFDNPGRRPINNQGDKRGNGGIIILVIILLLIATLVAVIAMDIGNIRSQHIDGFVRNAPVIGSLFQAEELDPLEEKTEEELRQEVLNLRNQVASLESQRNQLNAQIITANARIEHLSRFEASWQQFRLSSAAFVQTLAHNDSINFVEFFQDIVDHDLVPQDILALAFGEAQAINVFDEELDMLVRTIGLMDEPSHVAEGMEQLLRLDQPLAIRIMRAMSNTRRAEVYGAMEPGVFARFTVLLSTEPPTFMPLIPPPYLPAIIAQEIIITPPDIPSDLLELGDEIDEGEIGELYGIGETGIDEELGLEEE